MERRADSIEIIVSDDGPGIPDTAKEQVFTPFFRMESSRNRETGGVGLGLSIARTIVRRHGGDIVLINKEKGLHAAISLPPLDGGPPLVGRGSDGQYQGSRTGNPKRFCLSLPSR